MKLKQAVTGIAALACMTTAAHAQSAGSFYVTTGWFHLAPQSNSDPLTVTSIGGSPTNLTQPNTGAKLDSADTIGFTAGYFVTDHIATEFVIGVPPSFDLEGSGNLAQFGKTVEPDSAVQVLLQRADRHVPPVSRHWREPRLVH
jgi:outer membrane protein